MWMITHQTEWRLGQKQHMFKDVNGGIGKCQLVERREMRAPHHRHKEQPCEDGECQGAPKGLCKKLTGRPRPCRIETSQQEHHRGTQEKQRCRHIHQKACVEPCGRGRAVGEGSIGGSTPRSQHGDHCAEGRDVPTIESVDALRAVSPPARRKAPSPGAATARWRSSLTLPGVLFQLLHESAGICARDHDPPHRPSAIRCGGLAVRGPAEVNSPITTGKTNSKDPICVCKCFNRDADDLGLDIVAACERQNNGERQDSCADSGSHGVSAG